MKNSLKVLMSVLFTLYAMCAQAAEMNGWHERNHNKKKTYVSDTLFTNNTKLKTYLPGDLKGERGVSVSCDENGNDISGTYLGPDFKGTRGSCLKYHSMETKTSWIIRYVEALKFADGGGASHVFKIENGQPKRWIEFGRNMNDAMVAKYVHPEAQKFARKGGGNTDVAKNPGGQNQENAEVKTEEIIKQGVGALKDGLKGFKF